MALPLEDREHFDLEGLELYQMKQEMLEFELEGGNAQELLPVFRSRGMLPPARHGELLFRQIAYDVQAFAGVVRNNTGDKMPLAPLEIDLQVGEFRLTGKLDRLWPQHLLHYRCARMKVKDQMRSWIEHLVLNTVTHPGYPLETTLVMADEVRNFASLPDARGHLENLMKRYREGMQRPLHFFPRSSMAYAAKDSLDEARKVWRDSPFNPNPGEGSDPAIRRCFGSGEPFDDEFCRLSVELLRPMIDNSAE